MVACEFTSLVFRLASHGCVSCHASFIIHVIVFVYMTTHCCSSMAPPLLGGGGVIQARISAFQILYDIFVRNLFGVFKDLCRCTLGIAFAT